jgi:hypothetical protein
LAIALLAILAGLAVRARGPNRTLYGALFAATLTWAVHAGVDWDWEMPAVSVFAFAVGGAALARGARAGLGAPGPRTRVRVAAALLFAGLAVPSAVLAVSQARLNDSVDALIAEDCTRAVSKARSSLDALGSRAEPYQVIGYCELRRGREQEAVKAMQRAVDRDPGLWEHRYGLALARAAARLDPRSAARAALERNPLDRVAAQGARRFRPDDPRIWRSRALSAAPSITQLGRVSSGEAGLSAVRAAKQRR